MLSQQPVLRQEQRLKMTPQLYQAIRIMAMPLQELQVTIQEELEQNPALEVMEDNSTTSLDTEPEGGAEESAFAESSDPGYLNARNGAEADAKRQFIEGALTRPETLQDHLLWQLRLQPLAGPEFELGEMLIRNLDNNGFILEAPDTLAADVPPAAVIDRAEVYADRPAGHVDGDGLLLGRLAPVVPAVAVQDHPGGAVLVGEVAQRP